MGRSTTILTILAVLSLAVIQAQGADETGRYVLKSIDGGLLRLDTKTGAVSTCRKQGNNIICRSAADDRAVLQAEIDRLQAANDKLRASLAKRNQQETGKKSKRKADLPDDDEIDRIMGFFEKLMKRFFKFAQTMRDTLGSDI